MSLLTVAARHRHRTCASLSNTSPLQLQVVTPRVTPRASPQLMHGCKVRVKYRRARWCHHCMQCEPGET